MNQSSNYLIKSYLESTHEKPRTAVDRVYEEILRRIVNLELPPGSPLVRGELCAEYQVSQTPVREALLRLEQVGLINVRPQSGTEVAYIDVAQLEQNHFLREALECEVVRRLAEQQDQSLVEHLRSIIDMQEQVASDDGDVMLFAKLDELFELSALVLAQEYMFTDYDWRIGVLNGRALYACRYLMARNHWQIYNHSAKRFFSGGFETLPTFEVPKAVLDAALKAAKVVGNGLYGVDVKEVDGKAYVLEVNDNPSLDHDVEDEYLGDELYMQIMAEFHRRLEERGR